MAVPSAGRGGRFGHQMLFHDSRSLAAVRYIVYSILISAKVYTKLINDTG